jgi:hypothetical protein
MGLKAASLKDAMQMLGHQHQRDKSHNEKTKVLSKDGKFHTQQEQETFFSGTSRLVPRPAQPR